MLANGGGGGVRWTRAFPTRWASTRTLAAEINSFRRLLSVLDLRDRNLREWRRRRRCFVSDKNGSNAAPEVLWLSATGFPFTSAYSPLRFIGGCIWSGGKQKPTQV